MKYQKNKYYLGVDCGSVSLKAVVLNEKKDILWLDYRRTHGQPLKILAESIRDMFNDTDIDEFQAVVTTGSARNIVGKILNGKAVNEIHTHGLAGAHLYPDAKSIIEIGGQDSKLIFLEKNNADETIIVDSVMNDICAAGTGSFLDQQAFRMGITVEELSRLAAASENPAKIAGRCSVFTKTDMIHLQQGGVSKADLSAGLCEATVRTYMESLIKGKKIAAPILFQGGVANNEGMRLAFEKLLKLKKGDMIIPKEFDIMGAIGSCLYALKKNLNNVQTKEQIMGAVQKDHSLAIKHSGLPCLADSFTEYLPSEFPDKGTGDSGVYLGIDVGSVSAKLVAIDQSKNLIYKKYLPINGEPFESVKICLADFHQKHPDFKVAGVGVTGSGRNFIAKAVGADSVKNEITAQAYAAITLVPDVDTIFEIGGQDSKYIRADNGTVVDFIMNKTCAAGTGSFLAEQAARLDIDLKKQFSDMAFQSQSPVDMGTRCTVFMETDCIHYQQNNVDKADILSGLSYSIAKNYLEKVVGNQPIGDKIVFQGGVAFNKSVAAAFGTLLGKTITVPPHHEVTGALGIAYISCDEALMNQETSFRGFDLENRIHNKKTIDCSGCSNVCSLINVTYEDGSTAIYGDNCGRYENQVPGAASEFPNYFAKREALLNSFTVKKKGKRGTIGIPSMLLYFEMFPMWATFFNEIGFSVITSKSNSKKTYEEGMSKVLADTCFPIKAAYGAIQDLHNQGVEKIFVPFIINMEDEGYQTLFGHNCQYVQIIPDMIKASMDVELYSPVFRLKGDPRRIEKAFVDVACQLGVGETEAILAYTKAIEEQTQFMDRCKDLGKESLEQINEFDKVFVLIGHPYIIHDKFFNLNIVKRLSKLNIPVIPGDMLPLDHSNDQAKHLDLIWKTNNRAINIANYIHAHNKTSKTKLLPVLMTTFGCAPDSMLTPYLNEIFDTQPWLEIELDEHNSITGVLTRCEAFWESANAGNKEFKSFTDMEKLVTSDVTIEDIKREDRTLYVHEFSEAFVSVVEALRKNNVRSELIQETTVQSNMLGRTLSNEKHCRTYQVLLGDYMATTMLDGYDPERSAFMTFGYDEACRLALFKDLHELVLKEKGGGDVWLFGPTPDDPVDWIKKFGLALSVDMWEAMVSHDYLSRLKFEIRPYEEIPGSTDDTYKRAVDILHEGIWKNNVINHFKKAMDCMKTVKTVQRNLLKIGVVGDAFTRVHKYSMNAIFDGIEQNGGVVIIPPSWHDFILYGAEVRATHLKEAKQHEFWEMVTQGIKVLGGSKEKIEKIAGDYSAMFPDQSNKWLFKNAGKYMNTDIAPVLPSMFIGKTVDFVEQRDIDGLMNAHGFNCMLGKISTACYNPIRIANGGVPMLTFIDDGLQQTNISTRIEAFMDQARTYKEKKEWVEMKKAG